MHDRIRLGDVTAGQGDTPVSQATMALGSARMVKAYRVGEANVTKVFPSHMKTAPGEFSEGRFKW